MKKPALFLVLAGSLVLAAKPARADDSAAPGEGFPASRYETLWTKSPFSVATAEAGQESPDYSLVGIAQFPDVSYASLIERQHQEHFLISTDKATRGLTLTSITRGHDGSDTYAVVQKDGQPITLKLEQAPVTPAPGAAPGAPPTAMLPAPGIMAPQITMPGANLPAAGAIRPPVRFRRLPIHLPPTPAQQEQPAQPQSLPQEPVQAHTPPPPPSP